MYFIRDPNALWKYPFRIAKHTNICFDIAAASSPNAQFNRNCIAVTPKRQVCVCVGSRMDACQCVKWISYCCVRYVRRSVSLICLRKYNKTNDIDGYIYGFDIIESETTYSEPILAFLTFLVLSSYS